MIAERCCGLSLSRSICYDGYNQRAHDEVSMTLRSAASGTEGNDADPKVCVSIDTAVEPAAREMVYFRPIKRKRV